MSIWTSYCLLTLPFILYYLQQYNVYTGSFIYLLQLLQMDGERIWIWSMNIANPFYKMIINLFIRNLHVKSSKDFCYYVFYDYF